MHGGNVGDYPMIIFHVLEGEKASFLLTPSEHVSSFLDMWIILIVNAEKQGHLIKVFILFLQQWLVLIL